MHARAPVQQDVDDLPACEPKASAPRVLCYVNHFYGPNPDFRGKSTAQLPEVRRACLERTLAALRAIPNADIRVCGVPGKSLVPLDLEFPLEDSRMLVYESLAEMRHHLDDYDYFLNVEDDIEVPRQTFENIVDFDRASEPDACLHPNRLEERAGEPFCVDLVPQSIPGWTLEGREFRGRSLRVANNPHSAFLCLSRRKLRYGLAHTDLAFRGQVVGGPMASAYAHYHKPFKLYRSDADLGFHFVRHLDGWMPRATWVLPPRSESEALEFTAVLLSWKRPHNLAAIVTELRRLPEIREILIWNNDPDRRIELPGVTVVQSPRNYYCLSRYCMVPLARYDNIWFQDDDLCVSAEKIRTLSNHYLSDRARIWGCRGRNLKEGRQYWYEDVWGEVDILLGQTMMFHRSLLQDAFAALGELPPPTVEDDIAFSLLSRKKPCAVNLEPLEDLGMSDAAALYLKPGHAEKRQAAVDTYLRFRAQHPHPARRIDELQGRAATLGDELERHRRALQEEHRRLEEEREQTAKAEAQRQVQQRRAELAELSLSALQQGLPVRLAQQLWRLRDQLLPGQTPVRRLYDALVSQLKESLPGARQTTATPPSQGRRRSKPP